MNTYLHDDAPPDLHNLAGRIGQRGLAQVIEDVEHMPAPTASTYARAVLRARRSDQANVRRHAVGTIAHYFQKWLQRHGSMGDLVKRIDGLQP